MALSSKQKLFCYYYLKLGNIKEAAVSAGYPRLCASSEGVKILSSRQGQAYLKALGGEEEKTSLIKAGFERLAFGPANDAVMLAFSDEDFPDIQGLDLFNVSKLKRQKNGTVEIEFFDRQKALEALALADSSHGEDKLQSFFDAIASGAKEAESDGND